MTKANPVVLGVVMLATFAILAGLGLSAGGIFISEHEGDTLHLFDLALRMAAGEMPHRDFITPIGVLAIAPLALFLKLGASAGLALILAQGLMALILFPAIWFVAATRYLGGWAALFAVVTLALVLALIHGEPTQAVSVSMHYNRWAWAAAFLAISAAVLPPVERGHPLADGAIIGLALALMGLIKVTYVVAFVPGIAAALLMRGAWRTILFGLVFGALAAGLATLFMGGVGFWSGYIHDLAVVAASEVRPKPGMSLEAIVSAPAYLAGSLVALAGVMLLRQAGRGVEGAALLLLVPGFFYVTYQNFGNDPQWLILLGLMLIVLRPARESYNGFGWDVTKGLLVLGAMALALISGSAINMIASPMRNAAQQAVDYAPLVPGNPVLADVMTKRERALRLDEKWAADGPGSFYADVVDREVRKDAATFMGQELPRCTVEAGMVAYFTAVSADLAAAGLDQGARLFVADVLNPYHMYGAAQALPGGAPWYYGGLPGISAATYVMVPECALSSRVRMLIVEALNGALEAGTLALSETRRTKAYVLYRVDRIGGASAPVAREPEAVEPVVEAPVAEPAPALVAEPAPVAETAPVEATPPALPEITTPQITTPEVTTPDITPPEITAAPSETPVPERDTGASPIEATPAQ